MPTDPVAAVEAADIACPGRSLLREISLNLPPGSLTVIGGAGGSGKSVLLRIFWGAVTLSSGEIYCGGRRMTAVGAHAWSDWRRRIGIITADFPLFDSWSVTANIAAALYAQEKTDRQTVVKRTRRELNRWGEGLFDKRHLAAGALSAGEAARLKLARAFVRYPPVAFLDEPLAGIHPEKQAPLIKEVQRMTQYGTAVLVATTSWNFWEPVADELLLLQNGYLLRPGEITQHGLSSLAGKQ